MPQPCFHFDLPWGGGGGLERDWIPHCEVELTCEKRKKDGYSQVNSISRRTEGCSALCLHNSAILGTGGESCPTKAG